MLSIGCSVSYEMFKEVWEVEEVGSEEAEEVELWSCGTVQRTSLSQSGVSVIG